MNTARARSANRPKAARFWTAPVLWRFSIWSGDAKAAEDCRTPRRYRGGAPASVVQGPNACGKNERGLSMNRPKAARFWTAPVLWRFSIWSGDAKAAEDCRTPRRYRGGAPASVVQGPNACGKNERGLSMNRPKAARFWTAPVLWRFSIWSGDAKAAEDCRTPERYRGGAAASVVQGPNACGKNER